MNYADPKLEPLIVNLALAIDALDAYCRDRGASAFTMTIGGWTVKPPYPEPEAVKCEAMATVAGMAATVNPGCGCKPKLSLLTLTPEESARLKALKDKLNAAEAVMKRAAMEAWQKEQRT